MRRLTYHFGIHDLLKMRIRDSVGWADRAFMRPMRGYVHYACEPDGDFQPDLDIEIGPFQFERRDVSLVDRRFRVAPDYFACEDTYKILWWKVEICGFDQPRSKMRLDANMFGTAALGSRLIDCLVRLHLARRGAPAVHCCGVADDDGAYLLTGRSGVGKSTLAMRLLEHGYRLLGDNWVIVSQGDAISLHLPVNVHDYNVAPSIYDHMPPRSKRTLWFYTWARRLSGGFLKKATPVVLRDVFPDSIGERAPLRKVLTFSQGGKLRIRLLEREAAIRRIVANDMMDREAFHRYMLAYSTVVGEGPVATHWRSLAESLRAAIPEDVPFLDVVVPRRVGPDEVRQVKDAIKSTCNKSTCSTTTCTV